MIYVCENYKKDNILNNDSQSLKQVKYMTKVEFKKHYYFDYNKKTIYELSRKYGCSYEVSLIYLENMYYIENKNYNNVKLDKLVEMKNYLLSKNYLIIDNLFKEYLKRHDVIFDGYYFNKLEKEMIEQLKKITNVNIITKDYHDYDNHVYKFNTIDEEVEYVAFKICDLIEHNIPLKKIKIAGINNDYYNPINRIFNMYNLKIATDINIYSTYTVKLFIENYSSNIKSTLEILKENKCDKDIIDKIISILNEYNFISDYNLVKDFVIDDLRKAKITTHYDNEIEVIDILQRDVTDEYVFYLNYNQESVPKVVLDKDYITDDIRYLTTLDNICDINKRNRQLITLALKNIKNLIITYKLKTPFAVFTKANILDQEDKIVKIPDSINYSTISNQVNLALMMDNLYKYGTVDERFALFNKHYKIDYNSFDNSYKKINPLELYDYLSNKLTLSYTSMNDYYKCSFKYYLKYILKIDKNNDNTKKHIGSIFHYVLEQGCKDDIDINSCIEKYILEHKIEMSLKEKFFLNKLKEELPFLLKTIKKQDDYILLKKRLYEEKIEIKFRNKIDITFVGVIDKIMTDDKLYALIDYKTGLSSIDLKLNYFGINMQLAVYLYLAHKKFNTSKFAGFYLQFILNKLSKSDSLDKKEANLKLVGYSNTKYIAKFDKTYKDSSLIKSLKVKNDSNFFATSKVLSDNNIHKLINLVEEKINECINKIVSSEFTINPKNIDRKNIGCEFCIYQDICFMKQKDIVYLDTIDYLENN